MRIHGIEEISMLNGDGLRTVLWVSGCEHRCKGCHNPQTWNPNSGVMFTEDRKKQLFKTLEPEHVSGLTLSGGDPLMECNRKDVLALARQVKKKFPNKTIWLYTGFEYEDISKLPILKYVDVLVVGKFVEALRDENYPWAGSRNQRVLYKNAEGKFESNKQDSCENVEVKTPECCK